MIQNNWVNTDIYLSFLQKPLTKMCKNNHSTVYWESVISVSNRPEKKELSGSYKFNRTSLTVTPKRAEKWRKSYPFTIQAKARTFQRDFFPAKAQHCNVSEAERRCSGRSAKDAGWRKIELIILFVTCCLHWSMQGLALVVFYWLILSILSLILIYMPSVFFLTQRYVFKLSVCLCTTGQMLVITARGSMSCTFDVWLRAFQWCASGGRLTPHSRK